MSITCARCGKDGDPAPADRVPFAAAVKEKVLAAICAACWKEWEGMEVKVINEYRLNFMDPRAPRDAPAGLPGFPRASRRVSRPRDRMIHVEGLTKRYGERVLLEDVSWHVKKRDRIGLSGPERRPARRRSCGCWPGSRSPTRARSAWPRTPPSATCPRTASSTTAAPSTTRSCSPSQELLALKDEQHQIEEQLAEATHDDGGDHERLLERYAEVTERFKHLGG